MKPGIHHLVQTTWLVNYKDSPSPTPRTGIKKGCHPPGLYMMLGIRTQVLMFAQQVPYSDLSLHSHHDMDFKENFCLWGLPRCLTQGIINKLLQKGIILSHEDRATSLALDKEKKENAWLDISKALRTGTRRWGSNAGKCLRNARHLNIFWPHICSP